MKSNGNAGDGIKIVADELDFYYGNVQALKGVNLQMATNRITALIGPSGCGKSTFLRCLNRMNDLIDDTRVAGRVVIEGKNIYDPDVDEVAVRKRIGMVFQQPNPFPKSIYENLVYAPLKHGLVKKGSACDELVESSLQAAGLWTEVKDKLHQPGTGLSGGQQQRLCIARAIAIRPDVILMDEPTSALDPISTRVIEQLMLDLKEKYTIVIVTHNMQQACRIADDTAHFHMGEVLESQPTEALFGDPKNDITRDYISGRFG